MVFRPEYVEPTLPEPETSTNLCRPFLNSLHVSGASVTVITSSGTPSSLCASDWVAARLDELQFELGEGPQWSAARSGHLVMIPDVASESHDDWPVFGAALGELPVGALFCVPIRMGAVTLGVATLHSATPRRLSPDEQTTALAIGSAIAGAAAHEAISSAADDAHAESTESSPVFRREVHQATGILIVQLNATATLAYARLQAYAFANGRTVQAVAHDLVTGALSLDDSPS